jgi:phosphatidylglycerophosphate synthase
VHAPSFAPLPLLQDGRFARKFDQCTTFGAVLDMVTDRCAHMEHICMRIPS